MAMRLVLHAALVVTFLAMPLSTQVSAEEPANPSVPATDAHSDPKSTKADSKSGKKDKNGKFGGKKEKGKWPRGGGAFDNNPLQPAIEAANWVLATYDLDDNGHLSPEERQKAVNDPNFVDGLTAHAPLLAEHLKRNDSEKKRHMVLLRLTRLKTLADQHDRDNDGALSDDERKQLKKSLEATIKRRLANLPPEKFAAIDTDGDGELSDEELAAWRQKKAKRWQQRLNTEQPAQDN